MTHPHRINDVSNWEIAKGAFWGMIRGTLSVGIPVLLAWYFFGHLLPGADSAPMAKGIEVRIDV